MRASSISRRSVDVDDDDDDGENGIVFLFLYENRISITNFPVGEALIFLFVTVIVCRAKVPD